MQTGIIGLPKVGKTTLFRILTKASVDAKGGSQGTHVGVAKVPEPRLIELAKLYNPKKITYATVQYVDLGGIQGERTREALEKSFYLGAGRARVVKIERDNGSFRPVDTSDFDRRFNCSRCQIGYPEPVPALFSSNSPIGACPEC